MILIRIGFRMWECFQNFRTVMLCTRPSFIIIIIIIVSPHDKLIRIIYVGMYILYTYYKKAGDAVRIITLYSV